jgi:hypothetical protein
MIEIAYGTDTGAYHTPYGRGYRAYHEEERFLKYSFDHTQLRLDHAMHAHEDTNRVLLTYILFRLIRYLSTRHSSNSLKFLSI